MEKKLSNIEREKKEETLRELAQKARDSRIGVRSTVTQGKIYLCPLTIYQQIVMVVVKEEDTEAQERDQLRYERHKERERQRRLARAHPEKRSKLEREKDRDITEKIALGMPSKTATQESMFDQRLFNQSKVMSQIHNRPGAFSIYAFSN